MILTKKFLNSLFCVWSQCGVQGTLDLSEESEIEKLKEDFKVFLPEEELEWFDIESTFIDELVSTLKGHKIST